MLTVCTAHHGSKDMIDKDDGLQLQERHHTNADPVPVSFKM